MAGATKKHFSGASFQGKPVNGGFEFSGLGGSPKITVAFDPSTDEELADLHAVYAEGSDADITLHEETLKKIYRSQGFTIL